MTAKNSIAIIEDHPIMREGLAAWFTATGRWRVTGKASSLQKARELLSNPGFQADVLLLDIQLEDGWGIDIIPWIANQKNPRPAVLAVYSAFDDYAHVSAALAAGVRAYVCKRSGEPELEEALEKALCGEIYVDDTIQARLKNIADVFDTLTRRETEILSLVKNALSNRQIAAHLGISVRTVENILSCIYGKTGIGSRAELQKL